MVIGEINSPIFEIDHSLVYIAQKNSCYYSFVNPAAFGLFDESKFKDVLQDWGFFGTPESRPVWYQG